MWDPGDKEQTVPSHGAEARHTISSVGTAGAGVRDRRCFSVLGDSSCKGQVASQLEEHYALRLRQLASSAQRKTLLVPQATSVSPAKHSHKRNTSPGRGRCLLIQEHQLRAQWISGKALGARFLSQMGRESQTAWFTPLSQLPHLSDTNMYI